MTLDHASVKVMAFDEILPGAKLSHLKLISHSANIIIYFLEREREMK